MREEAERASLLKEWLRKRVGIPLRAMEGFLRKAAEKAPRREYVAWCLFLGLSCIFLWSAFFGPQGVVELVRLRGSLARLEEENKVLLIQNQALEKEVYRLRNSPAYMEKVAREEYGYAFEGETVHSFPEPDPDLAGRQEGGGEKSPAFR